MLRIAPVYAVATLRASITYRVEVFVIIVPEIETVVILVPRTGSGSLRRAIAATYPDAMLLYRHMEADGVPIGYDRWRRIGVVRHPLDRLWSLYKFLKTFGDTAHQRRHDAAYIASMRASVAAPFSDWILGNQTVFTAPYDSAGLGRHFPHYTVRHPLPENRKSQFLYLRPDLGTAVYQFSELGTLADDLGLVMPTHNATAGSPAPDISAEAMEYMRRAFAWDYSAAERETVAVAAGAR